MPLTCNSCSWPAVVLVEHPDLYRMVQPYCALHYVIEAPHLDPIELHGPEGRLTLTTHTVLRGHLIPKPLA